MEKIITYFGADSKVGVTMITQSVANVLALKLKKQNKGEKVLLLHLDGKTGFEYTTKKGGSLDGIKAAVSSDVLALEELLDVCAQDENLYMLKGTSNLLERKSYEDSFVKKLMQAAEKAFDHILIDAGSSVDLGLAIGSLIHSNKNLLVATQQTTCFESYMLKEEQIFNPLQITFDTLIINKFAYSSGRMLETENSLMEKYGIKKSVCIPLADYGWQAEFERETIMAYHKPYSQGIRKLANKIYLQMPVAGKEPLFKGVFRKKV